MTDRKLRVIKLIHDRAQFFEQSVSILAYPLCFQVFQKSLELNCCNSTLLKDTSYWDLVDVK